MADSKFNEKAMADLEENVQQKFTKAEVEANRATAAQSTPKAKARAFAQVLRKYGVDNVNEAELRRKFNA